MVRPRCRSGTDRAALARGHGSGLCQPGGRARKVLEDPIQDIDFQTDYCKDLSAPTDYEIDWDVQSDNFKHWEHHKEEDIATYRDHAHRSPVTGAEAPVHHTAWWEALDDSMETFMDTR